MSGRFLASAVYTYIYEYIHNAVNEPDWAGC